MPGRLEKLKELEQRLHDSMEFADYKSLSGIAKQYRETIREIEEIEGTGTNNDEIGDILKERAAHGEPGAVRPDRSGIFEE